MAVRARTTFAPTQRAAQWKQRVVREEYTQYTPPSTMNVTGGQHASMGITAVLPGPGSIMGNQNEMGSSNNLSLNLSRLPENSGAAGTGRSARSGRTGRSIAQTGRSIASNWSFDSRCSNLTEKALERIERLERVRLDLRDVR